jgi:hypothetical protein
LTTKRTSLTTTNVVDDNERRSDQRLTALVVVGAADPVAAADFAGGVDRNSKLEMSRPESAAGMN